MASGKSPIEYNYCTVPNRVLVFETASQDMILQYEGLNSSWLKGRALRIQRLKCIICI